MTAKTTSKGLYLSLNPELHALASKKADTRLMKLQEYIYELIRKDVLAPPPSAAKKNKARPKSSDDAFLDMFSRKR